MDLFTMRENVDAHRYNSWNEFMLDLKQIEHNAREYNPANARDTRGRNIVHAAVAMQDTAASMQHRFLSRIKYDLIGKCAKIAAARRQRNETTILHEGHKYIGKRVVRIFEKFGEICGRVTRYLPPGTDVAEDPALWHIIHDDGDEEDLEKHEIENALQAYVERGIKKGDRNDGIDGHGGTGSHVSNTGGVETRAAKFGEEGYDPRLQSLLGTGGENRRTSRRLRGEGAPVPELSVARPRESRIVMGAAREGGEVGRKLGDRILKATSVSIEREVAPGKGAGKGGERAHVLGAIVESEVVPSTKRARNAEVLARSPRQGEAAPRQGETEGDDTPSLIPSWPPTAATVVTPTRAEQMLRREIKRKWVEKEKRSVHWSFNDRQ